MRTLDDMLEAFEKIDIKTEIFLSLEDTAETYVQLQKEQLEEGFRSDDKAIFRLTTGSDEYSPGYAKYKGREKPIDLKDKGNFQADIFIDVREDEIFIDSADSKSTMLQEDYGTEILGLDEYNTQKYADAAGEQLVNNVTNEIDRS